MERKESIDSSRMNNDGRIFFFPGSLAEEKYIEASHWNAILLKIGDKCHARQRSLIRCRDYSRSSDSSTNSTMLPSSSSSFSADRYHFGSTLKYNRSVLFYFLFFFFFNIVFTSGEKEERLEIIVGHCWYSEIPPFLEGGGGVSRTGNTSRQVRKMEK